MMDELAMYQVALQSRTWWVQRHQLRPEKSQMALQPVPPQKRLCSTPDASITRQEI